MNVVNRRTRFCFLCLVGVAVGSHGWPSRARALTTPLGVAPPALAGDREESSAPALAPAPALAALVPNVGQWAGDFEFRARCGGLTTFLRRDGFVLGLCGDGATGAALRMQFLGARTRALVAGVRAAGTHNYFVGADRRRWRTDVPLYHSVHYRDLYAGIDLRCHTKGGEFEYDLLLGPGAQLDEVEVVVQGAERLSLDPAGDLVIETAAGTLRQPSPTTWQVLADGERLPLVAHYVLRGADRFGFVVPDWDGASDLVVDPVLQYATFLGGGGWDQMNCLAVDGAGVLTLAGQSESPDYPTTAGAFRTTHRGNFDVVLTRLDPARPPGQQLLYSTFLGGAHNDAARAMSVSAAGMVTLVGQTDSDDFPTTLGCFASTYGAQGDAFALQLDPARSGAQQLAYATYVGGSDVDRAVAVAVDAAGIITLAGSAASGNYPTTSGAFDETFNGSAGSADAVVTRLDPTQLGGRQLVYSTFLGGANNELASAMIATGSGQWILVGTTYSPDFPTTAQAFDGSLSGSSDGFVAVLDPARAAAAQLAYATFFGGAATDSVSWATLDAQGAITLSGWTDSQDYPTTPGAWDTTYNGGVDAFAARLDSTLAPTQQLVWSTVCGSPGSFFQYGSDHAYAHVVDRSGVVTMVGTTNSRNYPVTRGALRAQNNGFPPPSWDGFVSRLDPARSGANQLLYSSYLGGSQYDFPLAAVLHAGLVTIAGYTGSSDFPMTSNAFNPVKNANYDGFLATLDLLPTGSEAFGSASPACAGAPFSSVTTMPAVGAANFALTCSDAPPSAPGVVPLCAASLTVPVRLFGIDLWVDPSTLLIIPAVNSDARGAADLALAIPPVGSLAGARLHAQFLWLGPSAPPPCPPLGVSASRGLAITIQP